MRGEHVSIRHLFSRSTIINVNEQYKRQYIVFPSARVVRRVDNQASNEASVTAQHWASMW